MLVLRHVDCEPPAAYLPLLQAHGDVVTVRLGVDELPPDHDFGAIVAMGGPMGVGDQGTLTWLGDELAYIARALALRIPFWGVCLGAQLLAAALGAQVRTGDVPEVGIGSVHLTAAAAEDPVFGGLPQQLRVLHWHSDTFELPEGATLLATSNAYDNQAFRVGSAYGLQFHLETPPALAREWLALPAYQQSLEDALGREGPRILLEGLEKEIIDLEASAHHVMKRWLASFTGS